MLTHTCGIASKDQPERIEGQCEAPGFSHSMSKNHCGADCCSEAAQLYSLRLFHASCVSHLEYGYFLQPIEA